MKIIDKNKALILTQNICSKAEKCEKDIRIKLKSWNIPESETDDIILSLIQQNFINEKRFAISFTNEKLKLLKWGKIKIKYALMKKNISEENISTALNEISDDEYQEIITHELDKKVNNISANNATEKKAKLLRFASSRGYEQDICFNILNID